MMTVEEMRQCKKESGLSYEEISRRAGVPVGTVQKVLGGITKEPRYQTLQKLEKAFQDSGSHVTYQYPSAGSNESVCPVLTAEEPGAAYGWVDGSDAGKPEDASGQKAKYDRQGTYTLEDYLALPEDQRVELIDGVFYDMSSPYTLHQTINHFLGHIFENYIEENGGDCQVFEAPTDVQLDMDNRTIVEPDVMVVCHPERVHLERIYGAPDLVVEILSESRRKKDMTLKLWKYSNAGVREYWIVDPDRLKVTVWNFEYDCDSQTYSIHDKVPVRIYDGKLEVDFEKIWKRISRFY